MPSRNENGKRPNGKGSSWITKQRRLAIYLRDGFQCLCCGADLHGENPRNVTLDHIKARVDGGTHHESNLYTCCARCNFSRQDKPISRFAGPEALKHIRRNARRKLGQYVRMAKAILAGELEYHPGK